MGWSYAISSFIAIVALHGEKGLTKEEIFEINNRTYQAKFNRYFELIKPDKEGLMTTAEFIEQKKDKYFLKPRSNLNMGALESQIKSAEG